MPEWAGKWRTVEVAVGPLAPPPPHQLPMLMRDYALDLQARWDGAAGDDIGLTLEFLVFAEGRFLSIHPFRDFNGRTIRVFLAELLRRLDLPLVDKSAPFLDRETGSVRSTTGELFWDAAAEGCFTVNTPGTKAAVGYIGGRTHDLGEVGMRTDNPYAHLYVTALGKEETIANAQALLVTTVARMVDKGTVFDAYADTPLVKPEPRKGPTLIEPVKAVFEVKERKGAKVFALDHEGCKPDGAQSLPVEKTKGGVRFTVDGAQTKTVHYVVEFGR